MPQKNPPHRPAPPARSVPILSGDGTEDETEGDGDLTDAEALHEVESDIGINEWIDPETGEPAEGQSPPHLDQD